MKTLDFGIYILSYNFVIGLLLMIASEKLGVYAGYFTGSAKTENFAPDTNRHNHFRCLRRGFDGWNLSGWLCVKTVISR